MPQLTRITIQSGTSLNFRWPYQAKVMKMLEQSSSAIGVSDAGMAREGMGDPVPVQRLRRVADIMSRTLGTDPPPAWHVSTQRNPHRSLLIADLGHHAGRHVIEVVAVEQPAAGIGGV